MPGAKLGHLLVGCCSWLRMTLLVGCSQLAMRNMGFDGVAFATPLSCFSGTRCALWPVCHSDASCQAELFRVAFVWYLFRVKRYKFPLITSRASFIYFNSRLSKHNL